MRVALLEPPDAEPARALSAAGHTGAILSAATGAPAPARFAGTRLRRVPDLPLRARKIGDDLAVLPAALLALARGGFDAAHAFTPELACAAIAWGRRAGHPVVFTPVEPPRRETLAARRLRLAAWQRAVTGAIVTAPSEAVRDGLERWLAVRAPLLALDDAAAYAPLYRAQYPLRSG
jgi:hypothetical protein